MLQFIKLRSLLRRISILFIIVMVQLVCIAGCAGKKLKPDPKLVKTYRKADQIMAVAGASESVDSAYTYQSSAAIEDLINEMGRVQGTILNVRMKSDLKDLTMAAAEVFAHASNLGYNPGPGELKSVYAEWQSLKPRFKPFVGDAAEKSQ